MASSTSFPYLCAATWASPPPYGVPAAIDRERSDSPRLRLKVSGSYGTSGRHQNGVRDPFVASSASTPSGSGPQ